MQPQLAVAPSQPAIPDRDWRVNLLLGLAAAAALALALQGRMPQAEVLPGYHHFADQRTLWGVPNFWNVVTNLPFLLAALWGWQSHRSATAFVEEWERTAYRLLLAGLALTAVGSGYYHAWPDDGTLFWDRLPMAVIFMALLATTVGERINPRAGRHLLFPLLAFGAASVVYWSIADDLRLYVLVQFGTMLSLLLMLLLFPPRYSGAHGIAAMIGLYAAALALDHFDHQLSALAFTGGHPWKHLAAALAMLSYLRTVARRRVLRPDHLPLSAWARATRATSSGVPS